MSSPELPPLIYSPSPVSKYNRETSGIPILVRKYTPWLSPHARGENITFIPASDPILRITPPLGKQKVGLHINRASDVDMDLSATGRDIVPRGAENKGMDVTGKGLDESVAGVHLDELLPTQRNAIVSCPTVWRSLSDHRDIGFHAKGKNGNPVPEEVLYISLTRRSLYWGPQNEYPHIEAPGMSTAKHQRDSGVFMGSETSRGKMTGIFASSTFDSSTFTCPTTLHKSPFQHPYAHAHALATRTSRHDAATEAETSRLLADTSLLKRIAKYSLVMQALRPEKEELIDTVTRQNAETKGAPNQISELKQECRDQDLIQAVHVLHDLETQIEFGDARSSDLVEERRDRDVLVRQVRCSEDEGLSDEETAERRRLQAKCAALMSETVRLTEIIALLDAKIKVLESLHTQLETEPEHERTRTKAPKAENEGLLSEEKEVMGKEKNDITAQKQTLAQDYSVFDALVEALESTLKTTDSETATQKTRGDGLELRLAEETKRTADLASSIKELTTRNAQATEALGLRIAALETEKRELVRANRMLREEVQGLWRQREDARRERRAFGRFVEMVAVGMRGGGDGDGEQELSQHGEGLETDDMDDMDDMEKESTEVSRDSEDSTDTATDFEPGYESGVESKSESQFHQDRPGLENHGLASTSEDQRCHDTEVDSAPPKTISRSRSNQAPPAAQTEPQQRLDAIPSLLASETQGRGRDEGFADPLALMSEGEGFARR